MSRSLTLTTLVSAFLIQGLLLAEPVVNRTAIIEPYPKEKMEELNRSIKSFNSPAQKFLSSIDALEKAKAAVDADGSAANHAAFVVAVVDTMSAFQEFAKTARESKASITHGLSDYGDWLEMTSADLQRRKGKNVEQNSAKWLSQQAKLVREFQTDVTKMFDDVDGVAQDLAVRSASWAQSYRIAKEINSLGGGPDGRVGVYRNMAQVFRTARRLKELLNTVDGQLNEQGLSARDTQAKEDYAKSLAEYHEEI
jgi:hypothetical protein